MTSSCWGLAVRGQQRSVNTTLPREKPKESPDPTAHTHPSVSSDPPRPCSAGRLTANHPEGRGGVHLEGLGAWESLPGEEAWEGASVRDGRSGAMGRGGLRPCPVPCAFLPLLGGRGQASRVQPPEPEKQKERTLSRPAQAGARPGVHWVLTTRFLLGSVRALPPEIKLTPRPGPGAQPKGRGLGLVARTPPLPSPGRLGHVLHLSELGFLICKMGRSRGWF